ncbi:ferredoxin C 2, chloroplastic [Silene latifolia]|uniref:ferredoxin C 2, chloroplastic n=1 Tax=Silene latifolia TaxID=37657 RepID=UPI003D7844D0
MEVQSLLHYSSAIHSPLHRIPAFYRQSPPPQFKRRISTTSSQLQALTQFDNGPTSSSSGPVPTHKVTVHDRQRGLTHHFFVPEDQYILHTAEDQDISLPFACRHGCCTSCAVRVKSGELRQPEALGISAELKSQGYALLCVGYPSTDLEVETQDEDEVYWLQFGRYFARGPIERDDYALELALGDE